MHCGGYVDDNYDDDDDDNDDNVENSFLFVTMVLLHIHFPRAEIRILTRAIIAMKTMKIHCNDDDEDDG